MNWIAFLIALLILIIAFIVWMRHSLNASRQYASISAGMISVSRGKARIEVKISKIVAIQIFEAKAIHYFACWNLLVEGGEEISIDYDAVGVKDVLAALEACCSGFSHKKAEALISQSDIYGKTLTVWSAQNHHSHQRSPEGTADTNIKTTRHRP